MSAQYKTSYKTYPAWNYREELDDLNRASENGWQLVKGGCFSSKFVKNPDIRYRYQLDYQNVDDMGRYIETFREQGWEYVNSTFNGWHYFRKIYDPSLPDDEYEIFTDKESLREMNNRWARLALILGALIGALAIVSAVHMILTPQLPVLTRLLIFAIESAILIRGGCIMRKSDSKRDRRGGSALFAALLCIAVIGCIANIVLTEMRPRLSTEQNAETVAEPIEDNHWVSFDVRYPDNYYLDLDMSADAPFTFEVVSDDGEIMYSETGTDVHKDDIRVRLPKGKYWFSMTAGSGFDLKASIG